MYLIVGCGFLGDYLIKQIRLESDEPILATVRTHVNKSIYDDVEYFRCDVTDMSDLNRLKSKLADNKVKVFYLTASHNVDYVYRNPDEAAKVNIKGLKSFLETVTNIEKMFFASTDCVYGESLNADDVFSENSELSPINEYGRQKSEAERIVLNYGYNILRFSLLTGQSLSEEKNFFDKIYRDLSEGKQIEMIDGMKRQVISYADAARYALALSKLDKRSLPSIINVCGDKPYSKYDIGCILAERLNVSQSLVKKISEEDASAFFSERRASCINMDNSLLKSLLCINEISWEDTIC